jgi:beta-glucosidase-like glycosyl hydrolase/CubicO group peptidase (beta-lactamase class C family)
MVLLKTLHHLTILVFILLSISCGPSLSPVVTREVTDRELPYPPLAFSGPLASSTWVDSVLASMTVEEKVGQLIMAKAFGHFISTDSDEFLRLEQLVKDQKVGGFVMFQGDVYGQAVLINKLQRLSRIPLLVAADFERGVAMRVRRGTYFPDAMAIGATRNPEYAYKTARAIAEEARAIGVHQNLAPVADVSNNPNNPVINTRSFGEDRDLVAQMVSAFVRGTNHAGVVSTVKHFPGHGDTGMDSHLDLPVLPFDRTRLDSVELVPFRSAVDSGVMSVMVAHLEVPALDSNAGVPATLSRSAITNVLKEELGFQGLVVTDALDMQGLLKGFSIDSSAVMAVKAGVDVLLVPSNETVAASALLSAVVRGEITEERLNRSVRKILLVKRWLRLDEQRFVNEEKIGDHVGTREHRKLAREIARNAVTVIRNEGNLLPLQYYGKQRLLSVIISDTEDNRTEINRPANPYPNEPAGAYFSQLLRRRNGPIVTYRLTPGSNAIDFDSVLTLARRADVVLVTLYAKVRSASGKIGIPENMNGFLAKLSGLNRPTAVVSFGNPYAVAAFPKAQGLVCAYADAEVMVEAAVEALFGEIPVAGRLPVSIPGVCGYGTGLALRASYLRKDDPSSAGFNAARLKRVDEIVLSAIRDSAFPGAQVAVAKDGILVYSKSFGTYTYDPDSREIDGSTLFDLASLTKVVATTASVMRLIDQKKLTLEDTVGKLLPLFSGGEKASVTVRQLLMHTGGLPPFRKLYDVCTSAVEALDSIYATPLVAHPGDSTIYSDLGMIILGKVVEKVSGASLAEFAAREFFQPLRMNSTVFNPSRAASSYVAPTEVDTVWRKQLIQGTVHDENAALLGGVAGNAGLFSTASDLAVFMQMLLNGGTYGGVRYLADSTVQRFTRLQDSSGVRALGWDMKSKEGSSAGDVFSMSSFGHLGFTGTSIWADPERNVFVVFLTNRIHPNRANNRISKVRPALHDAVMSALEPYNR